ncbi:MAG: tail fiber domain-containing protein [Burkholderiales bacterium]
MRKLLTIIVLALGCFGAAQDSRAQACPGVSPWVFDDVLASDTFCTYITWMAQEGVSLGCVIIDANHRLFCPDNNVTRKQMSAFMFRLGEALLPSTCGAGQVLKWDGTQWACANDSTGGVGTVTSVTAGTGLVGSPNPITGSGTLNVDTAVIQSRVTGTCAAGSSIRTINANGTVVCEADDVGGSGTVTSLAQGTGITLSANPITTAGTISADTAYLQRRVSNTCAVGSSIRAIAADGTVTCQADTSGPDAFVYGGNSFGTTAILGTNDAQDVDLRVNTLPVLRLSDGRASVNGSSLQYPLEVELAIFGRDDYANLYLRQSAPVDAGGYLISVGGAVGDTNSALFYLDQYKPAGSGIGSARRLIIDEVGFLALNRSNTVVSSTSVPLSVGTDGFTGNAAYLSRGGTWTNGSSRTFKEDFAAVDGTSVLAKVLAMPVTTWRYRGSNEGRHMGPIAEDFAAAFGLGDGDRYIGTVDGIGVALAAIQGLNGTLEVMNAKLESKIAEQAQEIAALKASHFAEIAELKRAVAVLLARTSPEGRVAAR